MSYFDNKENNDNLSAYFKNIDHSLDDIAVSVLTFEPGIDKCLIESTIITRFTLVPHGLNRFVITSDIGVFFLFLYFYIFLSMYPCLSINIHIYISHVLCAFLFNIKS